MTGGPPARIDRAALERILQRATELQAAERDPGHDLTADELLALGKEVGLPQRYLQQAMLEERARVEGVEGGFMAGLFGPAGATAQRVVQGNVEQVQADLIRYLDDYEMLIVQREQPGAVLWEPVKGFQAAVRRSTAAFGRSSRGYLLDRVTALRGTIAPLEAGYVHVSLTASLQGQRNAFVGGAAGAASVGAAGTAVLFALAAFPLVAILPVIGGAAIGGIVLRQYPPKVERVQLGLERALDHLQRGDTRTAPRSLPPRGSIGSLIASEIRKALK
ncbi:MAG TPA: hypothetical protein VFK36_07780 [Gemmatimonadales bacterium]|nr:hypothetical protein [Gemmatimonadales bacterium]